MNIYKFINSRDIREHWEKIGYKPSPLESAWLVWQNKNHTMKEKHGAYLEVINNAEDCSIPEGIHNLPQPSLHDFLTRYTEIELHLISMFYKEEPNAVYSHREHFDDDRFGDWYEEPVIFHTFEEAYTHAKGDGEPPHPNFVEFIKTYIGDEGKQIFVRFNLEKEIVRVDEDHYITDEKDYEIFYEVFENMWFSFPTPFHKGDIVRTVRGKYTRPSPYADHFVLTSVCNDGERSEYFKNHGDGSDMTAHGYFVDMNGVVYHECVHEYLDLEYERKTLDDFERLLIPISAYLKGEIDLALLLGAQRIMLYENEAQDVNRLLNYTKERKRIAGMEKWTSRDD